MTKQQLTELTELIPEADFLSDGVFSFIEDEKIRDHISVSSQYIIFLVSLEERYALPGTVSYSSAKTIIVHLGSIIEALLYYKLQKLLDDSCIGITDLGFKKSKFKNEKLHFKIDNDNEIYLVNKVTFHEELTTKTQFIDLIKAAKNCGLLTSRLAQKANKIREKRNQIHINELEPITLNDSNEVLFDQSFISSSFQDTYAIRKRIEDYVI